MNKINVFIIITASLYMTSGQAGTVYIPGVTDLNENTTMYNTNCPYNTTSMCVRWLQQGGSGCSWEGAAWRSENDDYWNYYGHLPPYGGNLSLKLKLLANQNSVHVINGKGQENYFNTQLLYAKKEINHSSISPRKGRTTVAFYTLADGNPYIVNLSADYRYTENGFCWEDTEYCTRIGNEQTCHSGGGLLPK